MPTLSQRLKNICKAKQVANQISSECTHTHYTDMDDFMEVASSDLEAVQGHSDSHYDQAHDCLITHLSGVGRATEDMEDADFILSRYDANSNPIGIVSEYPSPLVVRAILDAQKEFMSPYSVHLDGGDCGIIVVGCSSILTYSEDSDGDRELSKYGFTLS